MGDLGVLREVLAVLLCHLASGEVQCKTADTVVQGAV